MASLNLKNKKILKQSVWDNYNLYWQLGVQEMCCHENCRQLSYLSAFLIFVNYKFILILWDQNMNCFALVIVQIWSVDWKSLIIEIFYKLNGYETKAVSFRCIIKKRSFLYVFLIDTGKLMDFYFRFILRCKI